jgi:5S rRNA maturation endonuclease (ribonuclease M5)
LAKPSPNISDFIKYCNSLEDPVVLVVEGKRDSNILHELGIDAIILEKSGFSIHELVDQIYHFKTIIILTDFDAEGKRLRRLILNEIQSRKGHGRIDSHARQLLFRFCRAHRVSEIEDLKRFIPLDHIEKT